MPDFGAARLFLHFEPRAGGTPALPGQSSMNDIRWIGDNPEEFELGEALGQMDFETAGKLSGPRFVVLKKGLGRMERALGQFMLDLQANEHGYTEVAPPLLVKDDVMFGTTQLPKFKADQFQTALIRNRQPDPRFKKKIANSIKDQTESIFQVEQSPGPALSITLFWSPKLARS